MASMTIEVKIKDLAQFTRFAMTVEKAMDAANELALSAVVGDFSRIESQFKDFVNAKTELSETVDRLME
jgi:hypothetical protein